MTLKTTADDRGRRADVWLAEALGISRSAAAKLLPHKALKLSGGEVFEIDEPEPEPSSALPDASIALDIVFEDADLLVVNKQRGLVVHPAPGHRDGTLVNALIHHCGDSLSGIGGVKRPGIIHRLDKDTSGLMIVAKNDKSHEKLSISLKNREIERYYLVIIQGFLKENIGILDFPIGRHPRDRVKMAVTANGRNAVTRYEMLEELNGHSLLRCKLETGRTHQIRVHLAHIGHPVAGDTLYGARDISTRGQLLHSASLRFAHPTTGERLAFDCPPPKVFEMWLAKLRQT